MEKSEPANGGGVRGKEGCNPSRVVRKGLLQERGGHRCMRKLESRVTRSKDAEFRRDMAEGNIDIKAWRPFFCLFFLQNVFFLTYF